MRWLLLVSSCVTAACSEPLDMGTDLIWATDNESGDLSAWSMAPGTGGAYPNDGSPTVEISSEQAHSGRYSIKISGNASTSDPTSSSPGGGLYKEGPFPQEAYYSAWYYVPQVHQTTMSWTILKFQSPTLSASDAGSPDGGQGDDAGDAAADGGGSATATAGLSQLLDIRLQSVPNGNAMVFVLFDHRSMYLTSPLPNPPAYVPIATWFHLECFYRNAIDSTGHLTVWVDGKMIYDVSRPTSANPSVYFTICSLADNLTPPAVELYIDDVAISWRRVTPQGILKLTN